MKFLICPASQDLIDFCDEGDFFYSPNKTAFNFEVEFVEDEYIRINDTVGRTMPIDVSDLGDFIKILMRIDNYVQDKQDMQSILMAQLTHGASK
jgi:hypothetical protein